MNEIDKLLLELQQMKNDKKNITNTREVWAAIGNRDWESVGFSSEEEALAWIDANSYSNIA